jgi:hypothetical protein
MLAHVVYGIPICTLIFRNYYRSIPEELTDAAKVDGAGMLRTFWSVILPNSAPAFAVTLIWQFTSLWNDFLFAVFLTGPASWPTTVRLNNIAGSMVVPTASRWPQPSSPRSRPCSSTCCLAGSSCAASWPAPSKADPLAMLAGRSSHLGHGWAGSTAT